MSGHKYIGDSNNLFFEEDVDDETFLKNSRRNFTQPNFEEQRQSFAERKETIENRTIKSTERSISLLRDSEQVGIATAEELMRQREQLEKTDKRLDEINATLRFSQKHINGIKSVFGSFKNYLSGRNEQNPNRGPMQSNPVPSQSNLANHLAETDQFSVHPVTRLRDLDPDFRPQTSASRNFSEVLDANLDEMYGQISKLKGLATDLTEEIDSQNDLIGNIHEKTEIADITVNRQNKDMKRILKN